MKELHETQQKLLNLLKSYQESPLTIRELQEELDVSSPSVVYHHIQQLEKKGYLKRNPHNPKDYIVLSDEPEKPIVYINQYGLAQCGPGGSILDGNPVDKIPIASRLLKFPAKDAFIVEAKGDSMEPVIYAGDIVIARMQPTAEKGDIVVCVHDGEALIKRYAVWPTGVHLESLNKYDPIKANRQTRIEGVVKNILHYGSFTK